MSLVVVKIMITDEHIELLSAPKGLENEPSTRSLERYALAEYVKIDIDKGSN